MMAAVKRLFIGGLPAGIKENDLTERFSRFGDVKTVELKIRKDEEGVPTKTFAYINIETSDEQLKKCCSTYNNAKWKGSEMKIQIAKENFLERLEKERQQQKEIPVEDIACKTIPLKKPGEDAGVKDFQLKAKPGTQVPGEKDWVVGKYGRVLPIVNIQKKGYRGKTVTVDPSKFTHCLKAIKDEEAKDPVSTVSSLTWELDVQDNEITKKRKGEFPQWKKGKKSKGMDAASWLKQQEEERQRLLALEPELEIVPLSEGVGRPSGVSKTGSKHTAKSNVEFNSDSGDSDDATSIVTGLNGTHKNVLNDLSRFDSDSDNDQVAVTTKSNFVGRANDLSHSGSKASSVKSQDNFTMLNPKNNESEAKAEKIHGKGEKKPILPKRNLKQVQKLQGFRGTKFLDDSDTECGKQTKHQSINIDDLNVKSAVASLVKEGENDQEMKKNTADTKIPEKHLGSGKKVIDRIGKGKVSKIVNAKKDESEEESSTNSNGDDNEEGEASDAIEMSEDSCEDEDSDDNVSDPIAMEVSEESDDDVSSPDTDEIFQMTQNSRKFTEKLVGDRAKQPQNSLKKNLNSPSKSSKMVADSHSKAKESVKNTESLIPIVGVQGIKGSFLTKRLLCDEFRSGIDFSTGSADVSKNALGVSHDSEDDDSDFESLVKKAEAKLKSSKGKQNTLLNVQENLNISNLGTNVQKGYHSSDEEEDIVKTNTAEVNKPKSVKDHVLQKTITVAQAKKQVDKDTGDVSESESDSESSEEQSDNANNEDDSGDGSDTIVSKSKIDKKVNKADINRNSQDKPDKDENKDKMKNINGKDKDVSDTESDDDTGSSDDDDEEEEVSEGDGDSSNAEESDIDFESLVAQEVAKVDSLKSINVADCSSEKKDIKVKNKTNKQSEKSKLSSVKGLSDSSSTNFDLSQNKKQDALNSKKEDLTKNGAGTSLPLQKDRTSNKAATKPSEASRHTPEDKEEVDRKRLIAVKQRVKENEAQKSAIQMALAKDASGTNTNKRIVFDSDSESNTADPGTKSLTRQDSSSNSDSSSEGDEKIEKHKQGSKTDDTSKTSKTLFDSSEDDDSDDDDDKSRFDLRPEFEGTAGKKLLKLQSRYGDDQRFKLDQRFEETDSDGEEEKGAVVAGSDDEKMRSLRILQSITGTTITAPLDVKDKAKKTFKDVSNLKYDPSKEDHSQFEIKMAEKKKKDKKTDSKKSSAPVEEIPPVVIPEVSRERFHEVSESLKLAFTNKTAKDTPTNQGFSLLAAFGHHNEEEDRMSDDNDDAEAIPIPATLRSDQLSLDNRFKVTADHSDTDGSSAGEEEEAEDETQGKRQDQSETMETEETESHKSTPSSFFFNEEDERLNEGAKFYRKLDVAATREKWLKTRHDYIENFRSKHKRNRHSHSSTPSNKPGQKFTGHRGRGGKRRF